MENKEIAKISKLLSFVLRHKPEAINLNLDKNGWANIFELIEKAKEHNEIQNLNFEIIKNVVDNCDKQRFIISEDQTKIRANQGHSINIELNLEEKTPPEILYHGTAKRFLDSILKKGITSQERHHVHLSLDKDTAISVGKRYGSPVLLSIKALEMCQQGHKFYLSENGVWLTQHVPVKFVNVNAD